MAKQTIWTPDGPQTIGGAPTERQELTKGVGEWLRQFADVAEALKLGMHCAKCKKDLVGRNSDADKYYALVCDCREFVWENREYRAMLAQRPN